MGGGEAIMCACVQHLRELSVALMCPLVGRINAALSGTLCLCSLSCCVAERPLPAAAGPVAAPRV